MMTVNTSSQYITTPPGALAQKIISIEIYLTKSSSVWYIIVMAPNVTSKVCGVPIGRGAVNIWRSSVKNVEAAATRGF